LEDRDGYGTVILSSVMVGEDGNWMKASFGVTVVGSWSFIVRGFFFFGRSFLPQTESRVPDFENHNPVSLNIVCAGGIVRALLSCVSCKLRRVHVVKKMLF
jgi:hypothetical protein